MSSELGSKELTQPQEFSNQLARFKTEFKNIQLKKYTNRYELHDRYIISDNALVIVGHGMKDIASKESFVVYLPKKMVSSFLPTLHTLFEDRWKKAQNI